MKIAEFSVKNSQFTAIIFFGILALGFSSLLSMPKSEDPEFTPPGFIVVNVLPGASPEEVEDLVTDPIEERLGALETSKN